MKKKTLLSFLFVAALITPLSAQESSDLPSTTPTINPIRIDPKENSFHQIGIDIKASTLGIGGDIYYSPKIRRNPLSIKVGYDFFKYDFNSNFTLKDEEVVDFTAKTHLKTGSLSLQVAYQPVSGFYVTAGISKLFFTPSADAFPERINDVEYGENGRERLTISLKPGNTLSPYFGIGIGNFVPRKSKLSFALELGAYYMGAPKLSIETTGQILENFSDPEYVSYLEGIIKPYAQWYPVVKLNVGFRLFNIK